MQQMGDMIISEDEETSLATDQVPLFSAPHGRLRRQERGIDKLELKAAIKHGRKEPANPGQDGSRRWRFTHKDVIYITTEDMKHEITSWRLNEAPEPPVANPDGTPGAHVVLVVDNSGSMRKDDVPGHATRTHAVYSCLANELVTPQLEVPADGTKVTVVEMSNEAKVVIDRHPIDVNLKREFEKRAKMRAKSHGNYLPALDKVLEVLKPDKAQSSHLFLIFLSDGAPSDHNEVTCQHGAQVWQPDPAGGMFKGKPSFNENACGSKETAKECRKAVKQYIQNECLKKMRELGDIFGRDRVNVATVAFGAPNENYEVLQQMATAFGSNGNFQKLGLALKQLQTSLSTLSTTLTTLRTELACSTLTRRDVKKEMKEEVTNMSGFDEMSWENNWNVYINLRRTTKYITTTGEFDEKQVWDSASDTLKATALGDGAVGIAYYENHFAEGAERLAYRCAEINQFGKRVGPKLVAKETKHNENFRDYTFHETFCRVQTDSEQYAKLFNQRVSALLPAMLRCECAIRFIPCAIYRLWHDGIHEDISILAEPELEGKFIKWNNNGGAVASPTRSGRLNVLSQLKAVCEEEDESGTIKASDIPQCFSHFSYVYSKEKSLICDLQGTWNDRDGYYFTDPAMHHNSKHEGKKHKHGASDHGTTGIQKFFESHSCNALCRRLGLRPPAIPPRAPAGSAC